VPLLECHEASKHHLLKFGFFLLDSINLGFLLRERLATVLIIPSSWGSQLGSYPARIKQFFWRRCRGLKKKNKFPRQLGTSCFSSAIAGEKEDFCKGSLHAHPLLCFSFALLYFCLHHFIKNTKN
jgi:hypothetical protein